MYRSSALASPALAGSSTSARTPRQSYSSARSLLAIWWSRSSTASYESTATERRPSSWPMSSIGPLPADMQRPRASMCSTSPSDVCSSSRLTGLELVEIAPGVDLHRDILDRMEFQPIVRDPKLMDPRIFRAEPIGLRADVLRMPFDARFKFDSEHDILFINFEKLEVKMLDRSRRSGARCRRSASRWDTRSMRS